MSLRFSYRFKPEDQGKHVYFAYAVPYTYSQLTQDLAEAKIKLLSTKQEAPLSTSQQNLKEAEGQQDQKIEIKEFSPIFRLINKKDYLANQNLNYKEEQLDFVTTNFKELEKKTSFN